MKTIIRFVLGLLFLIGIAFLVRLTRKNIRFADDISQLEAELGRLPVEDFDRIHVVAIKEPRVPPEVASHVQRVWQYRCYLPAGYDFVRMKGSGRVTEEGVYLQGGFRSSWSTPKPEATQTLVTVSLSKDGDQTQAFFSIHGSGHTTTWSVFGPDRNFSDLVVQSLACPSQDSNSFDKDTILPFLTVYDPKTVEKKTVGGSETATYMGGMILLCPKSRESDMGQIQKGRVPEGFDSSWIAKVQRNE